MLSYVLSNSLTVLFPFTFSLWSGTWRNSEWFPLVLRQVVAAVLPVSLASTHCKPVWHTGHYSLPALEEESQPVAGAPWAALSWLRGESEVVFFLLAMGFGGVGQEILPRHCSKNLPWDLAGKPKPSHMHSPFGRPGFIPGLGRSPGEGKGYPLQYSGLENSVNSIVHGIAKRDTTEWFSLSLFAILHTLCLGQLVLGFLGSMRSCVMGDASPFSV